MMTTTETDCTISPTISHQHLALSRQTSKSSLLSMKLTLPNSGPGSPSSSSQRSLGYSCKSGSDSEGKHHHSAQLPTNPTYYVSYTPNAWANRTNTRACVSTGAGGAWHPRILADQLTLFKPGGRLCSPHYIQLGTRGSKF